MNSKNSEMSDPYDKYFALSNLSNYYRQKNIKKSYRINKFKTSDPTFNDKFGLSERLYTEPDISIYFEHIIKKMKQ